MLKKKSIIPHDKPVFREVIPQALKFAWTHPTHWLLGIFAAILFSGGALDIFWKFTDSIQKQGQALYLSNSIERFWYAAGAASSSVAWAAYAKAFIAIALFIIIIFAILAFSCICQGALVHAIGNYKKDKKKSLRQALTVGSRAILPIVILNIMIIVFIWLARFGVSFPLGIALGSDNPAFAAVYVVSFIVFTVLTLGLGILQIYTLNALILQKTTLAKALERAWKLIKEHWLVTIETIIVQSLIIIVLVFAVSVAGIILTFPATILFLYAFININTLLYQISLGIFFAVMLLLGLLTTGFSVAFQYATWTMMFHKFGEGGAIPKLHRLFKQLFSQN